MLRITDQYFWSFVFAVFFLILTVMGAIILETEAYIVWRDFALFDYLIVTLATWRVTRLFVHDTITRFIREQFLDIVKVGRGYRLEKPKSGPRRFLAELFSSEWAMSVCLGGIVLFVYLITPYAIYPLGVLAISAAAQAVSLLTQRHIQTDDSK